MKWLAIALVLLVSVLEVWWGGWWRALGVSVPVTGIMLFGVCLWLDRQWWPWLGLGVGLLTDIFGAGVLGQFSLWWWLGMSGAWWLDGKLARDNRWRWWLLAGYLSVVVGLLPLYETIWLGQWQGLWPGLTIVCVLKSVYFLLFAWPLGWWLGKRKAMVE